MEDIIMRLNQVPLFASLSDSNKAILATIVMRRNFPRGATVVRQGNLGTTLFIVNSGEVIASTEDERGRQVELRSLRAGDYWGETSLLIGEPRDATVYVQEDAELFYIRKSDFDQLVSVHPEIWQQLAIRPDVQLKLSAPRFPWLAEDERVEWFGHKHWIVFARGLLIPALLCLSAIVLLVLLGEALSLGGILAILLGVLAIASPLAIWSYVDWRDDYHVITNNRVVHVERVPFQYQARDEAPLDKVQNIDLRQTMLGSLLGYAHLNIITASARGGQVKFLWVTEPELVTQVLNEQIRRIKAQQKAKEYQEMVQLLEDHIFSREREQSWERPHPTKPSSPVEKPTVMSLLPRGQGCARAITDSALYSFLMQPHLPRLGCIRENGNIIWRKHWILLLKNIALPSLLSLALFAIVIVGIKHPILGLRGFQPLIATLPLWIAAWAWLVWQYEDWRNDLYVVTDTQIIDIERTPFLFYETRRQASLENIQDIRFEIPGFWASIFNLGHVVIQTAGQGQFTFESVYDPSSVQKEIFGRLEALRERKREAERKQREAELADWLSIYHHKIRDSDAPKS